MPLCELEDCDEEFYNEEMAILKASAASTLRQKEDVLGLSVTMDSVLNKAKPQRKPCPHGIQRSVCRDCGGIGICKHNRQKKGCKECKGSSICEHARMRYRCRDCGGNGICEHDRIRSQCKDCKGSRVCEHDKLKQQCRICGFCQHGKRKTRCSVCGGSELCKHGRISAVCSECDGISLCPHRKQKQSCKDCNGSQICIHKLRIHQCKDCTTIEQQQHTGLFCAICAYKMLNDRRKIRKGGSGICAECEPDAKKRLEHRVRDALLPMITQSPEAVESVRFGTDCDYQDKAYRMPDLLWAVYDDSGKLTGIIKVGVDEDSHSEYTAECEGGKVCNQSEAINELAFRMDRELAKGTEAKLTLGLLARHLETRKEARLAAEMGGRRLLPQFYLKVNFDAYDGPRTTWETRLKTIADRVNTLLAHLREGAPDTDTTRPHVEFYWYHSKSRFIMDHFMSNAAAVHTSVH